MKGAQARCHFEVAEKRGLPVPLSDYVSPVLKSFCFENILHWHGKDYESGIMVTILTSLFSTHRLYGEVSMIVGLVNQNTAK